MRWNPIAERNTISTPITEGESETPKTNKTIFLHATLGILIRPSAFFTRQRDLNLLDLATGLQLFRWMFLSWLTMSHFYLREVPGLLPTPFGVELQTYRFFEIFAYFPFGMAVIGFIAYELWVHGQAYATRAMPFSKVWETVSFAYFAPWLPTAVIDHLLVTWHLADPMVIVPLHICVVFVEMILTATGLRIVFGIPAKTAWRLGIFGGVLFLVLAGAAVR